jgi:hypothetical protein
MAFSVRRVITGHDANGRAIVKIDEVSKNMFSDARARRRAPSTTGSTAARRRACSR